jgi:hypothetical protein
MAHETLRSHESICQRLDRLAQAHVVTEETSLEPGIVLPLCKGTHPSPWLAFAPRHSAAAAAEWPLQLLLIFSNASPMVIMGTFHCYLTLSNLVLGTAPRKGHLKPL